MSIYVGLPFLEDFPFLFSFKTTHFGFCFQGTSTGIHSYLRGSPKFETKIPIFRHTPRRPSGDLWKARFELTDLDGSGFEIGPLFGGLQGKTGGFHTKPNLGNRFG